jgi:hypothetical protein
VKYAESKVNKAAAAVLFYTLMIKRFGIFEGFLSAFGITVVRGTKLCSN